MKEGSLLSRILSFLQGFIFILFIIPLVILLCLSPQLLLKPIEVPLGLLYFFCVIFYTRFNPLKFIKALKEFGVEKVPKLEEKK